MVEDEQGVGTRGKAFFRPEELGWVPGHYPGVGHEITACWVGWYKLGGGYMSSFSSISSRYMNRFTMLGVGSS